MHATIASIASIAPTHRFAGLAMQAMRHALLAIALGLLFAGCSATDEPVPAIDPPDRSFVSYAPETPDSCFAEEYFDEDEQLCLLDCEGLVDEACDALADDLYGEFDAFIDEDFRTDGPLDEGEPEPPIARFSVEQNLALTELSNDEPESADTFVEIWRAAASLLPRRVLVDNVGEFRIDSDGPGETLAFVTQLDNDLERWSVSYDIEDYVGPRDREFIHTTVHEFAHIVFLERDQVDPMAMGGCPAFAIDEGCSGVDSHLNRFVERFWTDLLDENRVAQQAATEFGDDSLQIDFFEAHADRFVSEYAATNPVEDAAEVFTHFVLKERPGNPTNEAARKIAFLHGIPELVALRQTIRARLFERAAARR